VFCHEGVGNLAVFSEGAGGADLVGAHEQRVARHVGCDDCRNVSVSGAAGALGAPRT
jgi:hypothetical protein